MNKTARELGKTREIRHQLWERKELQELRLIELRLCRAATQVEQAGQEGKCFGKGGKNSAKKCRGPVP
jgi:primosomal protein N''